MIFVYFFLSHPWWRYRNTFLTITLTTLSSNMTNCNIHFPLSTGSAIYTIYTTNIVRYRLFLIHLFSMMQLKKNKKEYTAGGIRTNRKKRMVISGEIRGPLFTTV